MLTRTIIPAESTTIIGSGVASSSARNRANAAAVSPSAQTRSKSALLNLVDSQMTTTSKTPIVPSALGPAPTFESSPSLSISNAASPITSGAIATTRSRRRAVSAPTSPLRRYPTGPLSGRK